MFVRADRLLRGDEVCWHSLHALWYYWDGFRPMLDVFDAEAERLATLDLASQLADFELSVDRDRSCVGSFQDGSYKPCPQRARLEGGFDQCRSCASSWIPVQECIFEPRCDGSRCDSPLCRKSHVVYATFYGDLVKIGMTAGSRLRERAIEQGADAVARLVLLPNRLEARRAEKDISGRLRLPQRVRGEQVAQEIAKNPSGHELRARHGEILAGLEEHYRLLREPLTLLDGYPGLDRLGRLESAPTAEEAVGPHAGRMLAIKGRYLFYQDGLEDACRMMPLVDLTSRHLELGHKR